MLLLTLAVFSFLSTPVESPELESAVGKYWESLAQRDRAQAMQWVLPEDLNNFLNRVDAAFSDWRIVSMEQVTAEESSVKVSILRTLVNGKFRFEVIDTWVRTEKGWKVRVEPLMSVAERVRNKTAEIEATRMEKELRIFPEVLKFYAMSPTQSASITIRNGLDTPLDILSLNFDQAKFELANKLTSVPGRSTERIFLKYSAEPTDTPNQKSRVVLRLVQDGEEKLFEIPVLYNYSDAVTDWIQKTQRAKSP